MNVHFTTSTAWRCRWILVAACAILALSVHIGTGSLLGGNIMKLIFPDMSAGQVRGIRIVQGERTAIYSTARELKAIRFGPDGALRTYPVSIPHDPQAAPFFALDPFPYFYVSKDRTGVPVQGYLRQTDDGTRAFENPEWLWWIDAASLEARSLGQWGLPLSWFHAFNCIGNVFPAFRWEWIAKRRQGFSGGPEDSDNVSIIVSCEDGSFSRVGAGECSLGAGFILNEGGDLVCLNYDGESAFICDRHEKVVTDVHSVLGATPDMKKIFFTKIQGEADHSRETLWVYDTSDRTHSKLTDWVGHKFRVAQNSETFGFLDAGDSPVTEGYTYPPRERKILGAKVFDLAGRLVRSFEFPDSIHAWAYDWDPLWEVIVYHDEETNRIVVRSLDGHILGQFKP